VAHRDKFIFRIEYYQWVKAAKTSQEFMDRMVAVIEYGLDDRETKTRLPERIKRQIDLDNRQQGRFTPEYRVWRSKVFQRDHFTCAICGQVGGVLNAHHIKPYARYPEQRFDLNNGITLCEKCHKDIHRKKK